MHSNYTTQQSIATSDSRTLARPAQCETTNRTNGLFTRLPLACPHARRTPGAQSLPSTPPARPAFLRLGNTRREGKINTHIYSNLQPPRRLGCWQWRQTVQQGRLARKRDQGADVQYISNPCRLFDISQSRYCCLQFSSVSESELFEEVLHRVCQDRRCVETGRCLVGSEMCIRDSVSRRFAPV